MEAQPGTTAHLLSPGETAAALGSNPDAGLTGEEAARRLAAYGPNELGTEKRVSPLVLLLAQFKNVLMLVLVVATGLSLWLGHTTEAVTIGIIMVLSAGLGFLQEYRAERALEALQRMAAPHAVVVRGGQHQRVRAAEVVPGDVMVLAAGDRVPADGRVMEGADLRVDEAPLTGESLPVDKHIRALPKGEHAVADRANMVHAATTVVHGRGRALATATGRHTEVGRIATMVQQVQAPPTPLQAKLDKVGHYLAVGALGVVLIVVVRGFTSGQPFLEMLLFGMALAVAVVPESLPAVVTVTLALGVQRMAARRAMVRKLTTVETLGSTTVICSDKTGTLTQDQMTVRQLYVGGELLELGGSGYEPKGSFLRGGAPVEPTDVARQLLTAALLASDARVRLDPETRQWTAQGDPTEGALVVAAMKAGLEAEELTRRMPRVGEIPFTSDRKRMTTLHRADGDTVAFSKGAAEVVLEGCTHVATGHGPRPPDEGTRREILAAAQDMQRHALRVLAVAERTHATTENAEREMTLLGLVGMMDPPRPEAREAIATCRLAGVRVLMITGDHPLTAQAVARELGLPRSERVATGAELSALDERALSRLVGEVDIYARVSPADKLRVVGALQAQKQVTAMTGDGVNDAPALKKADIGVAMGIKGTDVARQAASMTLADDNFATIVAAVEEGRAIYDNVQKTLMYLLSSNIGEMALMGAAALLGLPVPLTALQILYVNLVTDGLPALALSVDPHASDLMARTPTDTRGLLSRRVVSQIVMGGVWSAVVNVALFAGALISGRSLQEAMTMTFVSLVLIQFLKAYSFRSLRAHAWEKPFANRWLNLAIVAELVLLALVVHVPTLENVFGTYNLTGTDWLVILGAAATVVPVLELGKRLFR
ncbi:MAG: cation-translocating P-type ATPase [Myxococcota bacterium]